MLEMFKTNVLVPSLGRVGSLSSGMLVGWGAQQQHADWVAIGLTGAGLVTFDLLSSWVIRKMRERGTIG